jgi:hypothetical protein
MFNRQTNPNTAVTPEQQRAWLKQVRAALPHASADFLLFHLVAGSTPADAVLDWCRLHQIVRHADAAYGFKNQL